MTLRIIRFINTFVAALVMGTVFGVWAGFDPYNLSAGAYIEQQQNLIRQLNVLMPVFGFVTILITLLAAFLERTKKRIMISLIAAALFFIATGIITRFGNQVINAAVINWNPAKPPANWQIARDQWWMLHSLRTVTAVTGMLILIWVNTGRNTKDSGDANIK